MHLLLLRRMLHVPHISSAAFKGHVTYPCYKAFHCVIFFSRPSPQYACRTVMIQVPASLQLVTQHANALNVCPRTGLSRVVFLQHSRHADRSRPLPYKSLLVLMRRLWPSYLSGRCVIWAVLHKQLLATVVTLKCGLVLVNTKGGGGYAESWIWKSFLFIFAD
jgi:hypothetical protein